MCQQVDLPEATSHIKPQLLESNFDHSRAVQKMGHIGSSVSHVVKKNRKNSGIIAVEIPVEIYYRAYLCQ